MIPTTKEVSIGVAGQVRILPYTLQTLANMLVTDKDLEAMARQAIFVTFTRQFQYLWGLNVTSL